MTKSAWMAVAWLVSSAWSGPCAAATRTWVSGIGDDAAPCTRTAPCKTFGGALAKTDAGGEINVLDPGAYNAVTINKSVTISSAGFEAGILATIGVSAVLVNAGPGDVVVLRGLDLEGLGSGGDGIRFVAGGALLVENCTINAFSQRGIYFAPSGSAQLSLRDTIVRNDVGQGASGIVIAPAGSANVIIDNVLVERSLSGISVSDRSKVLIRRTSVAGITNNGVLAAAAAAAADVTIEDSTISGGTSTAVTVAGVRADSPLATITLSNVTITNNASNGVLETNGGVLQSFGNNHIVRNNPDIGAGTVLAGLLPQ